MINISSFKTTKTTNPYNETDEVLELNINDGAVYRLNNVIKVSGTYTFSIWYKTNKNTTITLRILGNESQILSETSWKKFVKTITVNSVSDQNNDIDIEVASGAIGYFYEACLSEGVSDTSWTPAPEDIDDNIESVKSEFTQTAEEIKMSVKNIKGDVSNLNIQVGKIEQSVADNKGNISSLTTTIDGINATVKKQGESISSIDQKADKISQQVTSVKSELNSKIELTAGEISQKVDDVRADLSSEIKQTSDKISQTVTDMNKNLSTRIDQTAKDIELNASKTEELQNNVSSIYEGNLITNGFGTMKNNTNFTSWVYDGANKYDTYPSFKYTRSTSSGVGINDMKIPIDISKSYEFDMALKSIGSNNKLYLGFDEYDIDGNYIKPSMCMVFSNSTTTLVKDLKKGDTVVYLKSTSGFTQTSSTYQLGLIFWDYKDSTGYKYPVGVYSRNSTLNLYDWSGVNKTNNTITLKQPWDGLTHTVGTSVSQTNDSGHKYFNYNGSVAPTEWTRTNHKIAGIQSLYSFNSNSFNQATKYIKFMLYHNFAQSDNQEKTTILSKVSFVESTLKNNLQNNYYNKTETDAKLKVQSDNITANVKKEVTTIKNDLDQNYYNKTETDSKFQIQSDSITSTVKKEVTTQIGNIDIGGRNLLLNTGFNTFNHWIKGSNTKSLQMVNGWCEVTIGGTWSGFVQEFIPEKNVEYIVSYEAYLVDTVAETAVLETDFGTPNQNQTINKTPAKYSLKLKYPSTSLNGKIDFMLSNNEVGKKWRIRNIKLEKGNKATDWSPAPEDVDEKIDDIQIGGRNILKNSKNGIVCTGTDYSLTTTPGATITTKATGIGNAYGFIEGFYTTPVTELSKRVGTEFAFSLDVKITGSFTNLRTKVDFRDTSHNSSIFSNFIGINGLEVGKWTRVSGVASVKKVANVTATRSLFLFDWSNSTVGSTIEYRNLQLEEGNKSTAWTPAPEDMATADSLSGVNNNLTDVTNGLQSDINSTNKNLQDIQNSQNEVYEIVSQNKSQISSLTQRAEGFTMDFKTVNETVKQINNQFVTERDERYKYIKFIDGEIWLGKEVPIGEDDFKLVIKNDRISFLQNKVEVAYMSNNKLYVTDIHVTNSLQLGRFIFSARSNGNVGIRWINQ